MHAQGENVKLTLIHEITREDHITKFLDPIVREGLQDDNVHVVDTYIVGALIAMQHGLLTPLQVAEISALALAELGEISVTRYRKKQGLENRYFFLCSLYMTDYLIFIIFIDYISREKIVLYLFHSIVLLKTSLI